MHVFNLLNWKQEVCNELSYVNPTKIFFGQQQIAAIKDAIPADQRVLVIYGGGSIKRTAYTTK
ncbi:hypothetical protein HC02_20615 [Vibrio parahaemolyticus]|nr:hypothetical protein HC02_20615 [Vibrio parahaemolyticus]